MFLVVIPVWLAAPGAPAGAHQFGALQIDVAAPRDGEIEITITVDPEHLPPGVVPPETPAAERGAVALRELVDGL
ncbi:MAG: hypothetical protein ABIV06_10910, partial [Thermoanaerobaculia bacterium]